MNKPTETIGETLRLAPDRPLVPFFVVSDVPGLIGGPIQVQTWFTDGTGFRATDAIRRFKTIEEARAEKPADLAVIPRHPRDPPEIVESWL